MIRNFLDFKPFVDEIMGKCGVIRTNTLINCLTNYFENVDPDDADSIIRSLQEYSSLLVSEDGWTITKGCYQRITADTALRNIQYSQDYRLPDNAINLMDKRDIAIVECMPIVADMMPFSKDFVISGYPWTVQFIVETNSDDEEEQEERTPSRLYQVVRVDSGNEIPLALLINTISIFEDKLYKEHIRRIAVISDERQALTIPFLGFSAICVFDETEPHGFRVVQTRTGDDAWADYQTLK